MDFSETDLRERTVESIDEVVPFVSSPTVTWLNIDGLAAEVLERTGDIFGIHPLILEDIQSTNQRPKIEDLENYTFIVLRMIDYSDDRGGIIGEQVSLVLGENFVLSFQERPGDVFDGIRERIRSGKGRIRGMGPDYLAYALMDAVVDHHFVVLEKLAGRVEDIEEELIDDPTPQTLMVISKSKRELIELRKSVWPLREVIGSMERAESPLIGKETSLFLRDLYDNTIQVMDTIESLRDTVSGMLDIYLSVVSNRMNEIMKVLTIIATIFIPLTFIAGIYGMNFVFMPELEVKYAYFAVLGVMLAVGLSMAYYFRRKGWL
jgi:magnesium transporter